VLAAQDQPEHARFTSKAISKNRQRVVGCPLEPAANCPLSCFGLPSFLSSTMDLSFVLEWAAKQSWGLAIGLAGMVVTIIVLEWRVRVLRKKIREVSTEFETKLEQQAIDDPSPGMPAAPAPVVNNWQEIRTLWRTVRDRLEDLVDGIGGMRQKTYEKTSRYSYQPIIALLLQDHKITESVANTLQRMNETFLGLRRNARDTSSATAGEFAEHYRSVVNQLK
jgi:hypothetical protein